MSAPLIRTGRPDKVARCQAIDQAARSRYATLPGFEFVAQAPAIAAERFDASEVWVAALDETILGFVLLQSHGDTIYLANISVIPEAFGRGIGRMLVTHAVSRAQATGAIAVTLATFRAPPWNGPWFRRQGFTPIPKTNIGAMLRAILDRHTESLDMSTRETLWHRT
ncbi:MAG TPA: GNAT family N-acetyltransferase [Stellaceae bacterium]|nr:GNAT family N-acetyltransferase [Stellaceae bacterium]